MSVSGLLKTLVYVADLNAAEARSRDMSRLKPLTAAQRAVLEEQIEWRSFVEKSQQMQLREGLEDADEDEVEQLLILISVLRDSAQPLTTFEVMRQLQTRDVLHKKYVATARSQAQAMLEKLWRARQVETDDHGRWRLR